LVVKGQREGEAQRRSISARRKGTKQKKDYCGRNGVCWRKNTGIGLIGA